MGYHSTMGSTTLSGSLSAWRASCQVLRHYFQTTVSLIHLPVLMVVISASYHVCPTGYNFQFDSTFMYLMAGLLMLKIYQLRHPDVNPHAYTAYIFLSFTVLVEVGSRTPWCCVPIIGLI